MNITKTLEKISAEELVDLFYHVTESGHAESPEWLICIDPSDGELYTSHPNLGAVLNNDGDVVVSTFEELHTWFFRDGGIELSEEEIPSLFREFIVDAIRQ